MVGIYFFIVIVQQCPIEEHLHIMGLLLACVLVERGAWLPTALACFLLDNGAEGEVEKVHTTLQSEGV